jgi:hypothetical protein
MADKIKVWFDVEADFPEVSFSKAPGCESSSSRSSSLIFKAVVTGGHHSHGDTDTRFARLVVGIEVCGPHQPVAAEVPGELLGVGDVAGDLYGER